MSTEKEANRNSDDRSTPSTRYGGQQNQNQNPDKRQQDSRRDQSKQGSDIDRSRFGKQSQGGAEGGDDDVDAERHPEEQAPRPKEYKKDEQRFNDKSERA